MLKFLGWLEIGLIVGIVNEMVMRLENSDEYDRVWKENSEKRKDLQVCFIIGRTIANVMFWPVSALNAILGVCKIVEKKRS